jgi:DNA-binding Lrp family transcriptional regulator
MLTTDPMPNFPDFDCYNSNLKQWQFRWSEWLRAVETTTPTTISDPRDYAVHVDRRDLLIVKELQKNGRKSLAELAPVLGISLPAVKYRYDQLARSGVVKSFEFDVYPFPVEISAFHEVMLQFSTEMAMSKFLTLIAKLFFVVATAKVLKRNALVIRTYLPETQVRNMFDFFSEMVKNGQLRTYSAVRLDFTNRETQTISFELFHEERRWIFDLQKCLSELQDLTNGGVVTSATGTPTSK